MSNEPVDCSVCGWTCEDSTQAAAKLCRRHINGIDLDAFTILPLQEKFNFLFKRIDSLENEIIRLNAL